MGKYANGELYCLEIFFISSIMSGLSQTILVNQPKEKVTKISPINKIRKYT